MSLLFPEAELPEDRLARMDAHRVFDVLWKEGHCSRGAAYTWMRVVMELPRRECHIRRMDKAKCLKLIRLVEEKGPGTTWWTSWRAKRRRRWTLGRWPTRRTGRAWRSSRL